MNRHDVNMSRREFYGTCLKVFGVLAISPFSGLNIYLQSADCAENDQPSRPSAPENTRSAENPDNTIEEGLVKEKSKKFINSLQEGLDDSGKKLSEAEIMRLRTQVNENMKAILTNKGYSVRPSPPSNLRIE